MPAYALLGADLYLPPTLCTWVGGGPESTGKTSKPELLFLRRCRGRNWIKQDIILVKKKLTFTKLNTKHLWKITNLFSFFL
jgi:hypothetical protein